MAEVGINIKIKEDGSIVVNRIGKEFKDTGKNASTAAKETNRTWNQVQRNSRKWEKSASDLAKSWVKAVLAFLGIRKVLRGGKDITLFTAKVDLLRISMEQLGRVNNINVRFLNSTVEIMKSMGVATDDSIRSINSFIRLNLDLTKSIKFVRVAQDLAVISQKTTSQTVEQLTRGITTLNARMLRSAGVFFTAQQAAKEWADANDRTVESMTVAEKQAAVLNKIIEDGTKVSGAYEASLDSAGKKVLQLNRLWKEAKLALGSFTQDALLVAVTELQNLLKEIVILQQQGKLKEWGEAVAGAMNLMTQAIKTAIQVMVRFRGIILTVGIALVALKAKAVIFSIFGGALALLNTEIAILGGVSLVGFLSVLQATTLELGLAGAAAASFAFELGIILVAAGGLLAGFKLGEMFSEFKKLQDTIAETRKETIRLRAEFDRKASLKQIQRIQEELAKQEQARRRVILAEQEFLRIGQQVEALQDSLLSKEEKRIKRVNELRAAIVNIGKELDLTLGQRFELAPGFVGPIQPITQEAQDRLGNYINEVLRLDTILQQVKQSSAEAFLKPFEDAGKTELQKLEEDQRRALKSARQFGTDETAIVKFFAEKRTEIRIAELQKQLQGAKIFTDATGDLASNLNELRKTQGKQASRELFAIQKGAAIATAIINTALAATRALAELGPIAGPPAAALVTAAGLAQVAVISQQQLQTAAKGAIFEGGFQAFNNGGIVDRPTLGLIGEGRQNEAVVPLPDGRSIPVMQKGERSDARDRINIINVIDRSLIASVVGEFLANTQEKSVLNVIGQDQMNAGMTITR